MFPKEIRRFFSAEKALRFNDDRSGVTAVQYALLAALLALMIVPALTKTGQDKSDQMFDMAEVVSAGKSSGPAVPFPSGSSGGSDDGAASGDASGDNGAGGSGASDNSGKGKKGKKDKKKKGKKDKKNKKKKNN